MKIWSDLEKFSSARARTTDPYITISDKKLITLSSGFIRQAKDQIANNTHAILSFSKSNNAIVFEFINNSGIPGAIKLSTRDKDGNRNNDSNHITNASMAARSFFNHYKINTDEYAGRYNATLEMIPGLGERWVIYLNEKKPSKEGYLECSAIDALI